MGKIEEKRREWMEKQVTPKLKKLKLKEMPSQFYTPPNDREDPDFLEKTGFPGQYPFTAGNDPVPRWQAFAAAQAKASLKFEFGGSGASGAGMYAGFGAPEDYRDYLLRMREMGSQAGPNFAMDLPTQCGYDSDSPQAEGEVGRVGVAIDTLKDFEIVYSAYTGDVNIDKVSSNYTINAPAIIIIAMYASIAIQRGIPIANLRGTPQNDILKEFISRGTYIFPPGPSIRLFRDILVFCTKNMPKLNITSIGGYHIREAGATRVQDLAFAMANGATYLQTGIDAGLDIDSFASKFSFNGFGGSMEIYKEIAFQRAARRIWSRMLKERFGAKNPRSMMVRQVMTAHIGCSSATLQRPLNNLARSVVGAISGGMCGSIPFAMPPWDEPLGLGHSMEAKQLGYDVNRILIYEAKLGEVLDPWAGSYFMENLTDEIEGQVMEEFEKVEKMGGSVGCIESGYMQRAIARSAYERQKRIEDLEEFVVGVNCFKGPNELDIMTERKVADQYPKELMETAEERKVTALKQLKKERDNKEVDKNLKDLEKAAKNEDINLMPHIMDCVQSYTTLQEMCDVMRGIFGEYEPAKI